MKTEDTDKSGQKKETLRKSMKKKIRREKEEEKDTDLFMIMSRESILTYE